MRTAFAYIRVSDSSQLEGDGFPRQRAAIEQYAKEHDIQIARWFEEKGVSGTLADRPALAEMLAQLYANGTEAVIIEKLDRLARDSMVQERIVRDLLDHRIELISTAEPDLCSADPYRTAMRQVLGTFAQLDRAVTVAKLRVARDRIRAKTGRCEGRKPYGDRAGESQVLKRIHVYLDQGCNYTQIADKLNRARIKTRYGLEWKPNTVRRIVLREKEVA